MSATKLSLTVATLVVAMGLEIGVTPSWPARVQARSERTFTEQVYPRTLEVSQFVPPNRKAPDTTVGGASRGGCLQTTSEKLRSLTPANNLSLTTQEYPTLYWYIPPSEAKELEFELRSSDNTKSYTKTLALPSSAGVMGLNLQKTGLPRLELGQTYHWYFRMVCDREDRSGDVIVEGWIERTQLSQTLVQQLEKALPIDRPNIYAQAGIWQDSLALLAELRRSNPNDSKLELQWEQLLKSGELAPIVDKPLLD